MECSLAAARKETIRKKLTGVSFSSNIQGFSVLHDWVTKLTLKGGEISGDHRWGGGGRDPALWDRGLIQDNLGKSTTMLISAFFVLCLNKAADHSTLCPHKDHRPTLAHAPADRTRRDRLGGRVAAQLSRTADKRTPRGQRSLDSFVVTAMPSELGHVPNSQCDTTCEKEEMILLF